MRRFLVLAMLALGVGAALAIPAGAASDREFKAQFQDDDCVTHALCGTGLVEGYGHVTTTLDLTGGDFDLSHRLFDQRNCVAGCPTRGRSVEHADAQPFRWNDLQQQGLSDVHDLGRHWRVRRTR